MTTAKINALAELFRDIGSIFFASLFIGPFIAKDVSYWFLVPGILFPALGWFYGIKIVKE